MVGSQGKKSAHSRFRRQAARAMPGPIRFATLRRTSTTPVPSASPSGTKARKTHPGRKARPDTVYLTAISPSQGEQTIFVEHIDNILPKKEHMAKRAGKASSPPEDIRLKSLKRIALPKPRSSMQPFSLSSKRAPRHQRQGPPPANRSFRSEEGPALTGIGATFDRLAPNPYQGRSFVRKGAQHRICAPANEIKPI